MTTSRESSTTTSCLIPKEPIVFELSQDDKPGMQLPPLQVDEVDPKSVLGADLCRETEPDFPQLSEPEVVRHFTRLSLMNYQIDLGIYPLGSCTMKHNPRINEQIARHPQIAGLHPLVPDRWAQGPMRTMAELQEDLGEITGLPAVSLQPAAGAQGEFTALRVARAYFQHRGENRSVVITTDSAHGTNPASAAHCGFDVVEVPTDPSGTVSAEAIRKVVNDKTAVLMITNPNTLGRFEGEMLEIAKIVHDAGGLIYCDGANLNAILGVVQASEFGVDMMHINLHKTFSTPHGGGGPGSGPICCVEKLRPYLPTPHLELTDGLYQWKDAGERSVGKVKSFYGNFGMFIRAWAYIRRNGPEGLRSISENAVLNANYVKAKLIDLYPEGFPGPTLHESVLTDKKLKEFGVTTADLAKILLDEGVHPPTVYFPLIVKGALMIEPTESEGIEELDRFIAAMRKVYEKASSGEAKAVTYPQKTPRLKIDETTAARQPILTWAMAKENS